MPLPEPGADETREAFLDRCMANPTMRAEFPEGDQRFAVCVSQWEGRAAPVRGLWAKWSEEELQLATAWVGRKQVAAAPGTDPVPAPGRGSTLFLTQPLMGQIRAYDRELLRVWHRLIRRLAEVAASRLDEPGGLAAAETRALQAVEDAGRALLVPAEGRFRKAFETGQRLAVRFTGRSRLAESEIDARVRRELGRNARFIQESLLADLRAEVQAIFREPTAGGIRTLLSRLAGKQPAHAERVEETGDRFESRLGMYASKLWGVGHQAFAEEMGADGRALNWVLTSLEPCPDCQRLSGQGPYDQTTPLPTVPGLGETQCRTNCLCVLVEAEEAALAGEVAMETGVERPAPLPEAAPPSLVPERQLPELVGREALPRLPAPRPEDTPLGQARQERQVITDWLGKTDRLTAADKREVELLAGKWTVSPRHPSSLAMQRVMAERTGGELVYPRAEDLTTQAQIELDVTLDRRRGEIDRGMRTLYDLTQESYRQRGVRTVTLYRGVGLEQPLEEGSVATLRQNTLSSWSSDRNVAQRFALAARTLLPGKSGHVLELTVPVEDVLMKDTVLAGVRGTDDLLNEFEAVVIDTPRRPKQVRVLRVFEPPKALQAWATKQPILELVVEGPTNTDWLHQLRERPTAQRALALVGMRPEEGHEVMLTERGQADLVVTALTRAARALEAAAERLGAQATPIVVTPPEVHVHVPEGRPEIHVHVPPARPKRRTIKRDAVGLIQEIVEDEEEAGDGPGRSERG